MAEPAGLDLEATTAALTGALADSGASIEDIGRQDRPAEGPAPEIPGAGEQIDLTPEERDNLAAKLCDLIDQYMSACRVQQEREREIELHYALQADATLGGISSESQHLNSELMMSQVDQVTARIVDNIRNVQPLPRAEPIIEEGSESEVETIKAHGQATERFLHGFSMHDMGMREKFHPIVHRTAKVGTCVLSPRWVRRNEEQRYYDLQGEATRGKKIRETIVVDMPRNYDVIVWPPTSPNWQEADILGHFFYMTTAQWRSFALRQLEMSRGEIEELEAEPEGRQRTDDRYNWYGGVDRSQEMDDDVGRHRIGCLYARLILPGDFEATDLQIYIRQDRRKILWIGKNRHWNGLRPYFPIRYKIIDDFAWSMGVGHEAIFCTVEDAMLRNLQMENLVASGYHVFLARAGSSVDYLGDRPMPGQVIPVDDVEEDFKPVAMGVALPQINDAMADNRFRLQQATGLSSVMSGLGDPVMKSGAGTGSTVALIEQAGKKFGHVDMVMRDDLSAFYQGILMMVHQYAPNGLFYQYAAEEDASILQMTKYKPVRDYAMDRLRISVRAPNAATSREGRKSSYTMLWQFANQHYQLWLQGLERLLQEEQNPAGFARALREVLLFQNGLARSVIEEHDIPGLASLMPKIPEMTPADQQINAMMQQLQQAQNQIQQLQQQLQQMKMMGGGGMPPQPGGVM